MAPNVEAVRDSEVARRWLPAELDSLENFSMNEYQRVSRLTDRMPVNNLDMPLLGLFGEIGSLLSELKKKQRDQRAYIKYDDAVLEELGDVLWYLSQLASRADLSLQVLAQRSFRELRDWDEVDATFHGTFGDIQSAHDAKAAAEYERRLVTLAGRAGDLMNDFGSGRITANRDALSAHLVEIFRALIAAAEAADVALDEAARRNLEKTFSRWPAQECYPPLVDSEMIEIERLPRQFSMYFEEHEAAGKTYVIQKCNGIIVGDRLTDNKSEKDDYRFHDVFHISYAVFLGWSPVLRALFRLKRKSDANLDENQDGARAILIEEGVSTFIFGRGQQLNLYEGLDQVDYSLLKSIRDFTKGFEVQVCGLWQWEKSILNGFRVFRELKRHRRGMVTADLMARTLTFTHR
ncbi:MAG TPA: nucleoside triphosphate pyrophosphohydrolase family protein [Stellaceae bacterium]|jgi:NTP pyrophosphatase (non-canonical NTP hydrolase)|nr:nucleoside triphosphate pyrophosphohydrolase family protein [Stellaceae bacterium]